MMRIVRRMNLTAIRQVDPEVEEIISIALATALYDLDHVMNEWKSVYINGPLFVYKRAKEPFYKIIILTRLNTRHFIVPLTKSVRVQIVPPYLVYNDGNVTHSIWFYKEDELNRIATDVLNILELVTSMKKSYSMSSLLYTCKSTTFQFNIEPRQQRGARGDEWDTIGRTGRAIYEEHKNKFATSKCCYYVENNFRNDFLIRKSNSCPNLCASESNLTLLHSSKCVESSNLLKSEAPLSKFYAGGGDCSDGKQASTSKDRSGTEESMMHAGGDVLPDIHRYYTRYPRYNRGNRSQRGNTGPPRFKENYNRRASSSRGGYHQWRNENNTAPLAFKPYSRGQYVPFAPKPHSRWQNIPSASTGNLPYASKPSSNWRNVPSASKPFPYGKNIPSASKPASTGPYLPSASNPSSTWRNVPSASKSFPNGKNIPSASKPASTGPYLPSASNPSSTWRNVPSASKPFPNEKNIPSASKSASTGQYLPSASKPSSIGENVPSASKPSPTGNNILSASKPVSTGQNLPSASKPSSTGENVPSASKPSPTGKNIPSASKPASTGQNLPSASKPSSTGENVPSASKPSPTGKNIPSASKPSSTGENVPSASKPSPTGKTIPSASKPASTGKTVPSVRKRRSPRKKVAPGPKPLLAKPNMPSAAKPASPEQDVSLVSKPLSPLPEEHSKLSKATETTSKTFDEPVVAPSEYEKDKLHFVKAFNSMIEKDPRAVVIIQSCYLRDEQVAPSEYEKDKLHFVKAFDSMLEKDPSAVVIIQDGYLRDEREKINLNIILEIMKQMRN